MTSPQLCDCRPFRNSVSTSPQKKLVCFLCLFPCNSLPSTQHFLFFVWGSKIIIKNHKNNEQIKIVKKASLFVWKTGIKTGSYILGGNLRLYYFVSGLRFLLWAKDLLLHFLSIVHIVTRNSLLATHPLEFRVDQMADRGVFLCGPRQNHNYKKISYSSLQTLFPFQVLILKYFIIAT